MGVCEGKEDALDTDFVPLDTRLSVDNMFPEFLAQMSQLLPIQEFWDSTDRLSACFRVF